MNKNIIKKIENIAQHKDEEEEAKYYEKYYDLFEETYNILRKKKVLLYGGIAINELLPPELKFYKTTALPDIDVLTTNGEKLAKTIVKYFHKKGYSNITTSHSEALHPGTYKVYVDSLQILDITDIPNHVYKRLDKNSVLIKRLQLKVVDPQFLRMTLHLILAKGDATTVHRWGKVLERLILFYKHFPPRVCNTIYSSNKSKDSNNDSNEVVNNIPEDLTNKIYSILKDTDYILFGLHEVELLLDKHIKTNILPSSIQILVKEQNLKDIATSFVNKIAAHNDLYTSHLKISEVYKEDTLIPDHIFIYYKKHQLLSIFHANVCYGYNNYDDLKIASIHTIIFMYLCILLTPYRHFNNLNSLECLVNILALKQSKLRTTKKKLFQDVVSQCYGENIGLVTLRKNRLLRLASQK